MSDDDKHSAGSDTDPSFGSDARANQAVPSASAEQGRAPGEASGEGGEDAPATIVKICKQCMVSQRGKGGFCTSCGSELVPIRAVLDSYLNEVVGGKYKIVNRLGSGGMGEVYLGVNEPLGQRVAVKFLSKKFTADENIIMRFLNEARSYCKVTHPNAVTLLEYGQHDDGALYLITEFIEGKTLSDTLKEIGPLEIDQLISISTQICEVLSAAHGQGVIHRDLKPDNIMLMPTSRGRYAVKVLDFGIAKIMDDDHANGAMTETGSVFGTPEFMSPEQACGDPADARSDLYAVGIILFYLATGKLPFKGKNKLVVLHKQLHEAPPLPSQARDDIKVSPVLERVILKCLRKAPQQRYQSADELLGALEAIESPGAASGGKVHTTDANEPIRPYKRSTADILPESDPAEIHDSITRHFDSSSPEIGAFFTDEPTFDDKSFAGLGQSGGAEFSDDFVLGSGEISVDMADEREGRVGAGAGTGSHRSRNLAVGVVIAAIAAAGIIWVSGGSTGKDQDVVDGSEEAAAAALDIDQLLTTGQVLGSLAAAEDSLRHADFASASRAIEATDNWLNDAALPPPARERRASLRAKVARLGELDAAFSTALRDGDCPRAKRVLRSMSDIEAEIETNRADELRRCETHTAKEEASPAPEVPAAAPVAIEAAVESPTPDKISPEDAPPGQPDTSEGAGALTPKPEEPEEPANSASPEEPAETQPPAALPAPDDAPARDDAPAKEETSEDEAGDEDAEKPESEDPGFALPPKTLE